MDGGRRYPVTFLLPAGLILRASVQHQQDKQRIEEAPGPTVVRAGEVLADLIARPLAPGLYLVATPIGNLADISLRALAVLARAELIAAEDTRHSKKLLSHFGLRGEMTPYHEHNAERERPRLIARLRAGQSVALISDAGTPLISDPGYKLVREALDAGIMVTSIPGASAALAALTSVGLPTDTFLFAGFLPPKSGPRRSRLEQLKSAPATLLFFETGPRLGKSLADMDGVLGPREAAVAELDAWHFTHLNIVGKPEREQLQFALHFFEPAAHQALDGIDDAFRRLNEHAARAITHGHSRPAAVCRHGVKRHH